jgi:hypothetical protein
MIVRVIRSDGQARLAKDLVLPLDPTPGLFIAIGDEVFRIEHVTVEARAVGDIPPRVPGRLREPLVHCFIESESPEALAQARRDGWRTVDEIGA